MDAATGVFGVDVTNRVSGTQQHPQAQQQGPKEPPGAASHPLHGMTAHPGGLSPEAAQLRALLAETVAPDAARIAAAEAQLSSAAERPGYGAALLDAIGRAADPNDPAAAAAAVPAAAALHNFARSRWPGRLPSQAEREALRGEILRALLVAPPNGPVVKLLAASFRIVVTEDVTRAKCWPDLLPALCAAMQESNLMLGKEGSPVKTANALVAVHTLLKPYKYFQSPGVEKEAAPPELEAIVKALLEPLLGMLGVLASGTLNANPAGGVNHDNDALLHTLLKCFHHTVAAYMPRSLVPSLPRWLEVLVKLLERASTFSADDDERHASRARVVKRVIQSLVSLVTRHRRHVERALPTVCSHATTLAATLAARRLAEPLQPLASRQCALCFDLLARVAETAAGFKLIAPDFGRLLETAVFPALCAAPQDAEDWETDEEEFLQRNLPTDADDPTGFNDELYAPRQSASNLLGLLAERGATGGAPSEGGGGDKTSKRKKAGGKAGRAAGGRSRALTAPGDVALRFLERFPVPGPGADPQVSSSYFGVLVAYGGMSAWFQRNAQRGSVGTLARQRVLPVLSTAGGGAEIDGEDVAVPMVRAAACWALGELAATEGLPEELTHAALLRALRDPIGDAHPAMRSSAAAAIAAALHAGCWPKDWAPLLAAAAAAAAQGADSQGADLSQDADLSDASRARALRLVAVAAEVAPEHVGVPATSTPLVATLVRAASAMIPPPPTPLPPLAETALEAIWAVVEAAQEVVEEEEEEEEDDDDEMRAPRPTHPSLVALVPHVCAVLARAWLPRAWGLASWPSDVAADGSMEGTAPPGDVGGCLGGPVPCAMGDCSRLLSRALRWCPEDEASNVGLGDLVSAHAALLGDWDAWEEEEEETAMEAMSEAVTSCRRGGIVLRPDDHAAVMEAYSTFIAAAVDAAPVLGAARACRVSHAVLALASRQAAGGSSASSASDLARVAAAVGSSAVTRLAGLHSPDVPLAVPLVTAAAAALARVPSAVPPAAVADWARAAARTLVSRRSELSASALRLVSAAALTALGAPVGTPVGTHAALDPAGRAAAAEAALRAVLALRDEDGQGAEEEDDDSEGDADSDDSGADSDDSGADSETDEDTDDEETETEAAFLARYAEEARRLRGADGAGAGEDLDAGDVDEANDGSEPELDGVCLGAPGAEATALLGWLQSAASAADLGALAATLQAHPVEGLEQVRDLQTVLSSMASAGGGGNGGGAGRNGGSPTDGAGGAALDLGGLRL